MKKVKVARARYDCFLEFPLDFDDPETGEPSINLNRCPILVDYFYKKRGRPKREVTSALLSLSGNRAGRDV
jgi:hypothetical protein